MPKFMVVYRSSTSPAEMMANTTPEQSQAGMELWMQWAAKAGDAIVDLGSPVGSVAVVGQAVSSDQTIGGFSILQADSKDDLVKLLEDHPHFQTPGDNSIEVLEFLSIPGM